MLKITNSRDWIISLGEKLKLSKEAVEKAVNICDCYEDDKLSEWVMPKFRAAGAIYIQGLLTNGETRTQKEIASAANCSVGAIAKAYKKMRTKI